MKLTIRWNATAKDGPCRSSSTLMPWTVGTSSGGSCGGHTTVLKTAEPSHSSKPISTMWSTSTSNLRARLLRAFTCACMCAGTRTRSYSSLFQPCRFEVQKEEQRWRCYDYRLVLEDLRVDRAEAASVQKRLAHQLAALVFHLAVRINGASSPRLRDALTLHARLKLAHHHAARAP